MKIYWILFIIIIIINILPSKYRYKKIDDFKLIISFFLIFIYAAIRVNFGRDYMSYENLYYNIQYYWGAKGYEEREEFGYLLLNYIMPSFRSLLILLSAFTCYTYYWLFRNFIPTKYYWFAFLIMALFGNMLLFFQLSGLRNAVAINILILSFPIIQKRKIVPYFFLFLLAFFFHKSAIFFFPLAYLIASPNKMQLKNTIIWAIIFILFLTASTTSLTNSIAPFINTYFDRYIDYVYNIEDSNYSISLTMSVFLLIMFTLTNIILLKEKLSPTENMIFKLSLLFVFSYTLGPLNFRMSQYFAIYFLLSTVTVFYKINNTKIKYIYLFTAFAYLIYSFFIVFLGMPEFPYTEFHTILE